MKNTAERKQRTPHTLLLVMLVIGKHLCVKYYSLLSDKLLERKAIQCQINNNSP